ncbi:MAG: hypothetical protein QS748_02355 [Candidatus Endonucleobacter bathymodioli]|uniref:Uncharacterized protein n=1 Tax=Candidatus Endonucleibacter bathymodioli TaxID=539814 RepID=A0AA90NRR8_9GAMM|nr:hypothetical protein [Candidatus Endonucleobacter bathymodioli]
MLSVEREHVGRIKLLVDSGLSMAGAFIRVFEHHVIYDHKPLIDLILRHYAISGIKLDSDYFFIDGSRLSIDTISDCMLATKAINSDQHTNK